MSSDKPECLYKHLSGAQKRKKKDREAASNAKLAKQSESYFASFKKNSLSAPTTSALDLRTEPEPHLDDGKLTWLDMRMVICN